MNSVLLAIVAIGIGCSFGIGIAFAQMTDGNETMTAGNITDGNETMTAGNMTDIMTGSNETIVDGNMTDGNETAGEIVGKGKRK